jgi:hypothetical protein
LATPAAPELSSAATSAELSLSKYPSTSNNPQHRQNDQAYASYTLITRQLLIAIQAQRRLASPESTVPVTVPRSVSRSRRWRCARPDSPSLAKNDSSHWCSDHTTRPLRVPVLRKERRQAHCCWHLELPILQEDHRWRSLHRRVSTPSSCCSREYCSDYSSCNLQ